MNLRQRLDEIRQLEQKATPMPWSIFGNDKHVMGIRLEDANRLGVAHAQWTHNTSPEDAALLLALADAHDAMAKDAAMLRFLLGDEDDQTGRLIAIYRRWDGQGGSAGLKAEIQRWVDANAAMGADRG